MLKYSSLSISFGSKMSSSSSSSFTLLFQIFVYVNIIIILSLIDSRVIISVLNCSLNKYFCMSLFHYSLFGGSLISLWSLTLKGIPFSGITEPINWLGNCSLRSQGERVIVLQASASTWAEVFLQSKPMLASLYGHGGYICRYAVGSRQERTQNAGLSETELNSKHSFIAGITDYKTKTGNILQIQTTNRGRWRHYLHTQGQTCVRTTGGNTAEHNLTDELRWAVTRY